MKERTAAKADTTTGSQLINGGSKATIFPFDDLNIPSPAATANTNNNHLLDQTDAGSDERLRLPHLAIRFRNRLQHMSDDGGSLTSGLSTPVDGDRSSMSTRTKQSMADDCFDQLTSDDDFSVSQSVAWMDVSKFGSIFNHEGSSLFLKVGALCRRLLALCLLRLLSIQTNHGSSFLINTVIAVITAAAADYNKFVVISVVIAVS